MELQIKRFCFSGQGNYSACPQSVRWTAPEVLDNPRAMEVEEVFSTSADVYSFGVVMWELVMCDDPFEDINTEQEVCLHLKITYTPIPQ